MENIILNINAKKKFVLSLSKKDVFKLQMSPFIEDITLNVKRFPNVKKIALKPITGLIQANITFNIIQQALVRDVDPFIMLSQMDDKTLQDLDIKDDTYITSIT